MIKRDTVDFMIVDIIGDVPDMLGFGENHMGFKRKELLFSH